MRGLKASGLLALMVSALALAACSSGFYAAPVEPAQAYTQRQQDIRLNPDVQMSHERGW